MPRRDWPLQKNINIGKLYGHAELCHYHFYYAYYCNINHWPNMYIYFLYFMLRVSLAHSFVGKVSDVERY